MGAINVRVSDISGSRVSEVEAPDDVPVNRILVVLIERMNLPLNSPDGQLMSYKLHHRRTGQQLLDNQTLGQAGVTAGDELRLQPEITAGSGRVGRDAALRRRRPRSADGTEFSNVLTDAVAPLNTARTAQRAVPT